MPELIPFSLVWDFVDLREVLQKSTMDNGPSQGTLVRIIESTNELVSAYFQLES